VTTLATHLSTFLREYLPRDRGASSHTCETYAHTIKLLICFASERLRVKPSGLEIEQIDAPLVLAFLEHIESGRGNCARTRNARLAAVKSFCRFLEYRLPSAIEQCRQINAIPMKKADEALVGCLIPSPSERDS
jgi:integrase/recombinase XerD